MKELRGYSRRSLLKMAGAGMVAHGLSLRLTPLAYGAAHSEDPHYVLQVVFPGGWDVHYLFDARPLEMTKKKMVQNYLGEEPKPWVGSNGQKTLVTSLTDPLKPFKNEFSIINGVVMEPSFDGHDQNMAYWFSGSPFGGEFFLPHINEKAQLPLDFVQLGAGRTFVNLTNADKAAPLNGGSVGQLVERLKATPPLRPDGHLFKYLAEGMERVREKGQGVFAGGAQAMGEALRAAPGLADKIKGMRLADTSGPETTKDSMALMGELFKAKITRSASMIYAPPPMSNIFLDTHDGTSAKDTGNILGTVAREIVTVLQTMKDIPFGKDRSLLDVTTVLFTSEFGRTMRQPYQDFESTGTDHNPLVNSVLVAGKGIKGGMVLGASDFQVADETLSKAHRSFDKDRVKSMGRPFDFAAMRPRNDLPEEYVAGDYITGSSVVNTLYKLLSVDSEKHRKPGRNQPAAATLDGLLA